jgi:glutathione reductase (NADPH)
MYDFDLFVIGGGSGGVRCARIAASHGARVAIAEERFWGGTCVNVGCVPKKLMVQAAEYGAWARDAHGFGWCGDLPTHDWPALIAAKDKEISRLNAVYVRLLDGSGVTSFNGHVEFADPHTLELDGRRITAERIVIATGGFPTWPEECEGAAQHGIVSDSAFYLPALPKRVVMVGGGYIAVEFAGIFRGLGAEVDLVFRQDLPLRGFDHDLRVALADALRAQGVRLHPSMKLARLEEISGIKRLHLADGRHFDADLVFFATGRAPNTTGLGADRAAVALAPNGGVVVDDFHTTSQPHIFAIGDVSNKLNLTPVAIAQGHALADRLFGGDHKRDWSFNPIPTAVFSVPPLATCGLTEAQAAMRGPADIYLAQFTPLRHMMSGRQRRTTIKLVVDQASQRVVGAHMLGDDAAEMMQAIGVAMTTGATKRDFDRTIGIHPTSAEEWVTLRTRTRVAEMEPSAFTQSKSARAAQSSAPG